MLWILLYMVWDVPSILSILLLHWKKKSVTQDQVTSPKNNNDSDYDSSFLGKSSSQIKGDDFDITINSDLSDDKETTFEILLDIEPELSFY